MPDTTNFGWTKPTIGGDAGAWGTVLNTLFDDVDTDLNTVKTTADGALQADGSVDSTGEQEFQRDIFTTDDLGSITGATAIDLDNARYFFGTITGTTTFSFDNPPASGKAVFFTLVLTNGGSQTINWPASVDWPGGSAPALTASGRDRLVFVTHDGGTTWDGALSMLDLS